MLLVMLTLSRRSAVGRAVVRVGLPTYNPANVVLAVAKAWRTLHASSVSTRNPMDNKRINPVAWSSPSRYIGVNDNGRPFRRPIARSTRYSLRYASTASCRDSCSRGWVVT